MNTSKEANPTWWNDQHASTWERVKQALSRDWEQTKSDFGSKKSPDLNQGVGDTVKQAAGKEVIPPTGAPNFDEAEPALRFGYSAANQYPAQASWDQGFESKLESEWNDLKSGRDWQKFKSAVKRGWEHARPKH